MSGSYALGNKDLTMNEGGFSDNVNFHTCFNSVDIPLANIESKELLFTYLDASIVGVNYHMA
jgi:hypothetical protein